ncbi:Pseudouridine kinase [Linum grandiflorum]
MSQTASPAAERRLDRIFGHLCPPPGEQLSRHVLHQAGVSSGEEIYEPVGREAVVIGGMVLDIHAIPSVSPRPRTTTPGKVKYLLGGVGRNIAECMTKLGTRPYMISAVGIDFAGKLLLENWKSAGLPTEGIRKHQDINTAVISNIFDTDGELAAAVASVDAIVGKIPHPCLD